MKGKYVVGLTRNGFGTTVTAMIFPETLIHADVAVRFFGDKSRIIGAGFFQLSSRGDEVSVDHYGQSDSLGVASRLEDSQYLEQALGLREYPEGSQMRADALQIEQKMADALARQYPSAGATVLTA